MKPVLLQSFIDKVLDKSFQQPVSPSHTAPAAANLVSEPSTNAAVAIGGAALDARPKLPADMRPAARQQARGITGGGSQSEAGLKPEFHLPSYGFAGTLHQQGIPGGSMMHHHGAGAPVQASQQGAPAGLPYHHAASGGGGTVHQQPAASYGYEGLAGRGPLARQRSPRPMAGGGAQLSPRAMVGTGHHPVNAQLAQATAVAQQQMTLRRSPAVELPSPRAASSVRALSRSPVAHGAGDSRITSGRPAEGREIPAQPSYEGQDGGLLLPVYDQRLLSTACYGPGQPLPAEMTARMSSTGPSCEMPSFNSSSSATMPSFHSPAGSRAVMDMDFTGKSSAIAGQVGVTNGAPYHYKSFPTTNGNIDTSQQQGQRALGFRATNSQSLRGSNNEGAFCEETLCKRRDVDTSGASSHSSLWQHAEQASMVSTRALLVPAVHTTSSFAHSPASATQLPSRQQAYPSGQTSGLSHAPLSSAAVAVDSVPHTGASSFFAYPGIAAGHHQGMPVPYFATPYSAVSVPGMQQLSRRGSNAVPPVTEQRGTLRLTPSAAERSPSPFVAGSVLLHSRHSSSSSSGSTCGLPSSPSGQLTLALDEAQPLDLSSKPIARTLPPKAIEETIPSPQPQACVTALRSDEGPLDLTIPKAIFKASPARSLSSGDGLLGQQPWRQPAAVGSSSDPAALSVHGNRNPYAYGGGGVTDASSATSSLAGLPSHTVLASNLRPFAVVGCPAGGPRPGAATQKSITRYAQALECEPSRNHSLVMDGLPHTAFSNKPVTPVDTRSSKPPVSSMAVPMSLAGDVAGNSHNTSNEAFGSGLRTQQLQGAPQLSLTQQTDGPASRDSCIGQAATGTVQSLSSVSSLIGSHPLSDILFLHCTRCQSSYGSVHGFRKHFRNAHGHNPNADDVKVQSISATRELVRRQRDVDGGSSFCSLSPTSAVRRGLSVQQGPLTWDEPSLASSLPSNVDEGSSSGSSCGAEQSTQSCGTNGRQDEGQHSVPYCLHCLYCGRQFASGDSRAFEEHVLSHERQLSSAARAEYNALCPAAAAAAARDVHRYRCYYCSERVADASALRDHLLQHDGLMHFVCSFCAVAYPTAGAANAHMSACHESLLQYALVGSDERVRDKNQEGESRPEEGGRLSQTDGPAFATGWPSGGFASSRGRGLEQGSNADPDGVKGQRSPGRPVTARKNSDRRDVAPASPPKRKPEGQEESRISVSADGPQGLQDCGSGRYARSPGMQSMQGRGSGSPTVAVPLPRSLEAAVCAVQARAQEVKERQLLAEKSDTESGIHGSAGAQFQHSQEYECFHRNAAPDERFYHVAAHDGLSAAHAVVARPQMADDGLLLQPPLLLDRDAYGGLPGGQDNYGGSQGSNVTHHAGETEQVHNSRVDTVQLLGRRTRAPYTLAQHIEAAVIRELSKSNNGADEMFNGGTAPQPASSSELDNAVLLLQHQRAAAMALPADACTLGESANSGSIDCSLKSRPSAGDGEGGTLNLMALLDRVVEHGLRSFDSVPDISVVSTVTRMATSAVSSTNEAVSRNSCGPPVLPLSSVQGSDRQHHCTSEEGTCIVQNGHASNSLGTAPPWKSSPDELADTTESKDDGTGLPVSERFSVNDSQEFAGIESAQAALGASTCPSADVRANGSSTVEFAARSKQAMMPSRVEPIVGCAASCATPSVKTAETRNSDGTFPVAVHACSLPNDDGARGAAIHGSDDSVKKIDVPYPPTSQLSNAGGAQCLDFTDHAVSQPAGEAAAPSTIGKTYSFCTGQGHAETVGSGSARLELTPGTTLSLPAASLKSEQTAGDATEAESLRPVDHVLSADQGQDEPARKMARLLSE